MSDALRKRMTPDQLAFFESRIFYEPNSGCWLWGGAMRRRYGDLKFSGTRQLVHRASFEHFNGPIQPGTFVCHRCDVPICVNPNHLWLGTAAENNADRDAKSRQAVGAKITCNRDTARGSRNGKAKIAEGDILEILRRTANGESRASIARSLGVSPSAIRFVLRRKTWAHVSGLAEGVCV